MWRFAVDVPAHLVYSAVSPYLEIGLEVSRGTWSWASQFMTPQSWVQAGNRMRGRLPVVPHLGAVITFRKSMSPDIAQYFHSSISILESITVLSVRLKSETILKGRGMILMSTMFSQSDCCANFFLFLPATLPAVCRDRKPGAGDILSTFRYIIVRIKSTPVRILHKRMRKHFRPSPEFQSETPHPRSNVHSSSVIISAGLQ